MVLILSQRLPLALATILLQLGTLSMMVLVTLTNPGVIPQYIPGYELD